jgi:hypothetical protein
MFEEAFNERKSFLVGIVLFCAQLKRCPFLIGKILFVFSDSPVSGMELSRKQGDALSEWFNIPVKE